jgi:hypothetical protein
MVKLSVCISYSSNERMFLPALLKECQEFSDDIIVSVANAFYDGTPEDSEHINECIAKYPNVKFVEYTVDVNLPNSQRLGCVNRPKAYFHNLARWTAVQEMKYNWTFLIDADEIPEGKLVKGWLNTFYENDLNPKSCYKNCCYWYFKSPENQATTIEDSVLLVHRQNLTESNIFGDDERDQSKTFAVVLCGIIILL